MMFLVSEYKTASDEVNAQCDEIKRIIKQYDPSAMLIGEAPCTQDLITITDRDFKTVSTVSIVLIFVIIAVDMISALCVLLARGAVISFLVVAFILPAMFMMFDKAICKTSMGFLNREKQIKAELAR